MLLRPYDLPRAVLDGVFGLGAIGIVVFSQAAIQVIGLADVEASLGILQHVDPVSEGDGVYVLGYPMGLVDERLQYPVVRAGCIARIRDLLDGASEEFLVDAPVFPGNSGGPVILKPEIASVTGTKAAGRAMLIGVVKAYIPYEDIAISLQTKSPRVVFQENSGLSPVIPCDRILETIAAVSDS